MVNVYIMGGRSKNKPKEEKVKKQGRGDEKR
jgi:hypothetical protein